jgi:hypothetical protein
MNARKTIVFLGGLVALVVGAIVAISLFVIRKMEIERNQARTQKARDNRHQKKPDEVAPSPADQKVETQSDGELKEEILMQANNESEQQN